jgi:EAL domain-containing protein (putative c-di-GMP-specific phosphodiesterase class I)
MMLFINVDPNIINDDRFKKGATLEMLAAQDFDLGNIIFEITEKNSIDDYKNFRKVLDHYTSQGYKIAIDDTGAGYSGLRLLAETRPQFIKIDMDLVRDIDKDALKQALMKAFYEFSVVMNMKIIVEGIETLDELNALIQIGIPYGQGYLLQRPAVSSW